MTVPEPGRGYGLDDAIAGAQAADRNDRIEWRDVIAAHGLAGIGAVLEWVGDAEFGFFAVRVIEATGKRGSVEEALDALRTLRSIGASVDVRREAVSAKGGTMGETPRPLRNWAAHRRRWLTVRCFGMNPHAGS